MPGISGSIRAGRAFVELFADDSKLVRGLRRAGKKLEAFGKKVRDIGLKIAAVGTAVVTALLGAAKTFATMGDHVAKMGRRTGFSAEALSELGFAAEQSGADMETLEKGLRRMQRTIYDAARGLSTATEGLSVLGLSVEDLKGLSPEDQFTLIADRIGAIKDPTLKAAVAMEMFGRSGTQMLPLLENGAAGINALREEARRLGLTISSEDARAAEEFSDTLNRMWRVVKQAVFAIGAALAPTLSEVAVWITRTVKTTTDWIKQNRGLVVTVLKVAAVVTVIGGGLVALGLAASALGTVLGGLATIASVAGTVLSAVGAVIGAILSPVGLVIVAIVALGAVILHVTGLGAKALSWLGEQFAILKDDALAAFGGIGDALAAGDIGLAAKILWLTLKLEWERGIAWLSKLWLDFRNFFIRLSYDAFYGAVKACLVVWHGLEIAWIETTSFLSNTWTRFCQGIQKAWNWAGNKLSKAWSWLRGLFDKGFDSDAAYAEADAWLERENKKIDERANAAVKTREAERAAQRNREDEIHERAMRSVDDEQAAKKKALADEYDQRIAAAQGEVDAARKEWQDAIDEARRKREAGQPSGGGPPRPGGPAFDLDEWEGIGDKLDEVKKRTVGVTGTFNVMEAHGLGAGGTADRLANAAEQTAKNTKRLVDEATLGGLTFG